MEKPTIIQLTEPSGIRVATFEEAFGDHSEARGKRQEKKAARQEAKQTRKATKQASRTQKKTARIDARATKQVARQAAKQQKVEAKTQKKVARKVGRQEVKAAKQVAKQDRKTTKALMKQDRRTQKSAARMDRRAMRRPDELEPQELLDENAIAMQDSPALAEQQYEEPQYEEESDDSGYGTAESDEDAGEPTYHDDSEESDEEYAEEEYEEEPYDDSDSYDYDETGYGDEYGEDEYGADGEESESAEGDDDSSAEGDDSDFNGGTTFEFDSAEGQFKDEAMKQEANVAEIIQRQQANQMLIQRIIDKMKIIRDSMNRRMPDSQRMKCIDDLKKFKASLDGRNSRAVELQQQLEAFSEASGKRAAKQAARAEVKSNKQAAKVARKEVRQAGRTANVAARQEARLTRPSPVAKAAGRVAPRAVAKVAARKAPVPPPPAEEEYGVTEVEQGLNADIQENRIEVPAEETSGANGIELYAMESKNEEFVPEDRIVEIKYGADGIGGNIRKFVRPSLILGAAVLLTAYWVNKKYQWIKF